MPTRYVDIHNRIIGVYSLPFDTEDPTPYRTGYLDQHAGEHSPIKNDKLPPRASEAEAQRDLDAYALTRADWKPYTTTEHKPIIPQWGEKKRFTK